MVRSGKITASRPPKALGLLRAPQLFGRRVRSTPQPAREFGYRMAGCRHPERADGSREKLCSSQQSQSLRRSFFGSGSSLMVTFQWKLAGNAASSGLMEPEPSAPKPWPHAPPHWLFHPGIYMVTASTFHRQRILNTPAILDAVTHLLIDSAKDFDWSLRAWAVLNNHYHFLAESPVATAISLREWLKDFHRQAATRVNELAGCRGRRVWMNFRDTRVTHQTSYRARLRYVNQNPVHHHLVPEASLYRWCSAAGFETNAPKSFVESVARFKTDKLDIWDDFENVEEPPPTEETPKS